MDETGLQAPAVSSRALPDWLSDWTPFPHAWPLTPLPVHLIHGPPGFDQELLPTAREGVLHWQWKAGAGPEEENLFTSGEALMAGIEGLQDADFRWLCLTVSPSDAQAFPWEDVIRGYAARGLSGQLLLIARQLPARVLEWVNDGSGRQWAALLQGSALCYSGAQLERLAEQAGAASPESLVACVQSVTGGWPAISKALVWRFVSQSFEHEDAVAIAMAVCRQLGAMPGDRELDLAGLLQFSGPLPEGVFAENAPLEAFSGAVVAGLENGWLLKTEDGTGSLTPAVFMTPILTGKEIVTRYRSCLADIAYWLHREGYPARALGICLTLGCWKEAERVLLQVAEQYIAVLDVAPVTEWLDRLDAGCMVEHPVLLVCFIRLGIYEGSELKVRRYFMRLIEQLERNGEQHFREVLGEHRWRRLMAEVQLYTLVTGIGRNHPLIANMPAEGGSGTSPANLMQEAYQFVLEGRLADLLPVLCAGLKQTHQQGLWPYHTVFSILNFWALMLSGRRSLALTFLGDTRQLLSENQVSFTGAYEWLDLLDLLASRLEGRIDECKARLLQMIGDNRYFSDNIKCHVLLSLQCEMALTRHQLPEAETVLDELVLRRKSAASRSYWLPSTGVMEKVLGVLAATTPSETPEEHEPADNEIQAQTGLLWGLKMELHAGMLEGVEDRLLSLRARCASQGQWLRLLETRLLLAVVMLRSGRQREAVKKFCDVASKLVKERMSGVLLDPFLLWLPFLDQHIPEDLRPPLERLLEQVPESVNRVSSSQVRLTVREKQVLGLLVKGMRNQAIADELSVSVTTVRSHLQNIYDKLGVSNRAAATARALEQGMV